MADFALGLAKTAVEGTLSKVQSAIDEEKKLKAAAQRDLVYITGEFQMMQSFLKVANKDRANNEVVKTWVRQLRDLAFDVEDCVEFVIHLDINSTWTWVWRLVPSCMAPAWAQDLDKAVAELKQLKARVEEVSQRNTRYNLISDSGTASTAPANQLATTAGPSTADMLKDLWGANMKRTFVGDLQIFISYGGTDLKVVSIWRSAGADLSAAHILNTIYCQRVSYREFESRVRVKLMHPFDPEEFLKTLLNQLYVSTHQEKLAAKLRRKGDHRIRGELVQLLRKQRYLIILEDLSSEVDWNFIKLYLPDVGNGSRVVISTEQLQVALSCAGEPYIVKELREFPDGRYLHAFCRMANIDVAQFFRQLGQRRVISLWCPGGDTYKLAVGVYRSIKDKSEGFNGVKFKEVFWIEVSHPFDLKGFYRRFMSYDDSEEFEVDDNFLERRRESLRGNATLVFINGLQSREEWDSLKDTLLPEGTKSCIVIIAYESDFATYCEDDSPRAIDEEQMEANAAIRPFTKDGHYFGYSFARYHDPLGGHCYRSEASNCFLSDRIQEALSVPFIVSHVQQLIQRIMIHYYHVKRPGVNTVWGTIGVGKSAIVRSSFYTEITRSLNLGEAFDGFSCYEDDGPYSGQFERFGWVDVPDPFDLAEFSRLLLLDFHSLGTQEMEAAAVGIILGHDPIQGCYEIMRTNKCLVIIDGLRSTHEWDLIKGAFLCLPTTDSSMVVITADERVAKHCVNKENDRMVNVRALQDRDALDLFRKIAGGNMELTGSMLEYAENIVPKCGGLPKIIAAVAQASSSFWENTNDALVVKMQTDPQFHHLKGLLSWMHSYFDACSDSVKPCIFYLSVFPTNYKIRKGRLLRRWITEGYSRDTTDRTAKENAERLFSELVDMGIIQQHKSNVMCQINGFFREYIISQPMEDNLVFALEGHCKVNSQRTGQHLTIMKNWHRDRNVFESIDTSRLRSLTVFGKWESFLVSDNMKRIRVLDLEGTLDVKNCDLEHIFGKLLSLKFISLRGCRNISCFPSTLGGLRQLQTLDVRNTSILTLPSSIIKLQNIQYILAGTFVSPDEDWISALSGDNDGMVTSQPSAAATPPEGSDGIVTSPPQAAASPKDGHGTKPMLSKVDCTSKLSCSMLRTCVSRLPLVNQSFGLSERRKSQDVRAHNGGVEVPRGIGNMVALHTLGVVNVSAAGGRAFLTELTKLTQLLKLRVCGINGENWKQLCSALSYHEYLESMSVRLDEDCLYDTFKPPKTLMSLKLYGPICKLPVWIKELVNLKKLDLEITMSTLQDMHLFLAALPPQYILGRLCIKPIQEIQMLDFSSTDFLFRPRILKIDCSSRVEVNFRNTNITDRVEVLIIHCSSGSSLRISEEGGLQAFFNLNTVYLKGSYSNELVEHLKQHCNNCLKNPLLKLE